MLGCAALSYAVVGGGSAEMEVMHQLSEWAKTLLVRRGRVTAMGPPLKDWML
jgi:hypothetical protein